jgi:ABC-type arginine transport system permease subunit
MTGISFSPFVSGIIALSISESAFKQKFLELVLIQLKKHNGKLVAH